MVTGCHKASARPVLRGLMVACCLVAAVQIAQGALQDGFESAENSWQTGDADAQYRLESHQRITTDPHTGRGSELVQLTADSGTYIYFTHELGTARIVAELSPSVWIKANRPGIQLLARVVLPHTPDPRTGQPTATLVRGSSYSTIGVWQQLQITDTPQLLTRQVRALRAQLGPQVDAREAYVDQLLLNVYGGPGQTIVNIDDLEISGIVPRDEFVQPAAATIGSATNAVNKAGGSGNFPGPRQVTIVGTMLTVDGRPMFPRIIQWQGEPLAWLKQMGFNVVHTTSPITEQLLREAQQTGMLLIGPPPQKMASLSSDGNNSTANADLEPITPAFAPVIAWDLGSQLTARDLPATAALARQLHANDRQLRRPIVCDAVDDSWNISRQADVLREPLFPLGTSIDLKDYQVWLSQRQRLTRPGTPLWAVIQTEAAPGIVQQAAALAGQQAAQPTIDFGSLRLLVYEAFCSGMRGIEFASSSRLDATDIVTRQRATTLAMLNQELDLLEPWGAAGDYVTLVSSNDPDVSAVVLDYQKARLVVAMRLPKDSQYVAAPETAGTVLPRLAGTQAPNLDKKGDPDGKAALRDTSKPLSRTWGGSNISDTLGDQTQLPSSLNPLFPDAGSPAGAVATTLIVPGVPEDYHVYEFSPAGLRPLRHRIVTGGTAIAIEDFLLTSCVLITSDPTLETKFRERTKGLAPAAALLQRQLTLALRDEVATVDARLPKLSQLPSANAALATANGGLEKANQLLSAANSAGGRAELLSADYYSQAYLAARNAAFPLAHWKRETWQRATKLLPSPVSSPLAVSFNTLPEQLNFATAITGPPPGENLLVGGDFENLPAMLQAGWRHSERSLPDLQTGVELSPVAPYADQHSLHLQVKSTKQTAQAALAGMLVESPPVWVTSAPVHLDVGEVVCIRGQVRVPNQIYGSIDGLLIEDSLGGRPLAQRFQNTAGWREFVMYRAAPYAADFTLTFSLTGIGEAWIDDISVRPIHLSPGSTANLTSLAWPNVNTVPQRR
jgi:hypothetical protein